MQSALLHRFQGALVGALLGEWLGQLGESHFAQVSNYAAGELPEQPLPLSNLIGYYAQILAEPGVPWADRTPPSSDGLPLATLSTSAAAVGLLPLALFFHDADEHRADYLQAATATWQNPQLALPGLTLVAQAIALLLRERFTPLTMIPQLLQADAPQSWQAPLAQVQTQLGQSAGLHAMQQSLAPCCPPLSEARAIALAFYCFLSTPAAFELALCRALRLGLPTPTLALVGALSGAYNSLSGLPIGWRLSATRAYRGSASPLALANHLWATWAGVYQPTTDSAARLTSAIAAPQVIRQVGQRQARRPGKGGSYPPSPN